ncbi:C40 family peptidase [Mucilaginibacter sp. L3T2-6]|uniref:C40 family peptidase n=1 Tax=Mucilaginibacter sp. L3T2-6 TaxID=3062491 RepID=UPI002674CA34|nr:C40 family peptidase [Mucilaginibacter sp. L3T2-6]MDO3643351.1 C40 family peptidase [Mucilaginibacter sp. L3T2-6]MDV6215716.1 C40 family peptidase [Mucilaginibacter sp. L3T2-6]
MNKHYLFYLLVLVVIMSSCHSRRVAMRGQPGEIVKPDVSIADKYAAILGVDKSNIQNGRLYAFVEQWMGTPYKFGGEDKDGVDCSGLVQLLEQQVYGINIPRSTSQQINVIKRKYEEELVEGDLLFFDYDGKKFSHVAVYLQNGYYVHASSSKGVIITKLHDPYTYKYFSRCGSIKLDTAYANSDQGM